MGSVTKAGGDKPRPYARSREGGDKVGGRRQSPRGKLGRAKAGRSPAVERPEPPSPPPPDSPPARRRRTAPIVLAAILAAGVAVQLATLWAERIHWNADQAIVGLMGRHILTGREHPIFYYGSHYAGTLESHYLALVFLLFGTSYASYRLGMILLLLLHSLIVYAIARRAFGERAALFAAAYLAVPPFFFLYKGLTSDGAYTSLALLGAGMLYAAVRLEEAARRGQPRSVSGWIALLGALAGLAWWVLPLAAYFYLAILVWFLAVRRSVFRRFRHVAVFLAAFLLGSLPWWLGNVGRGWPSLNAPGMSQADASVFRTGFREFFTTGVPALFGARAAAFLPDIFPGASIIAFLVFALPLLAALLVLFRVGKLGKTEGEARRVLLLVVLTILSMQFLVAFNADTYRKDVRYLYPIYAPFALLAGFAASRARISRRTLAVVAAAVLLFNVVSVVLAPRVLGGQSQPSGHTLDDVIAALRQRGIREAYASYWMAYPIAFQSKEEIAVASYGLGTDTIARYPGYLARVAASANPAFVLFGREAERFAEYLRLRGSGAEIIDVSGYRIFWKVSPKVLEEAARLRHVPPEVVSR